MNNVQRLINLGAYEDALECAQRTIYAAAYDASRNNQSVAAKLLGVSRGTFRTNMKSWGLLVCFPKNNGDSSPG